MNTQLNGKTAIVCGSSQGIGRAAAIALSRAGARVILVARNEDRLKNVLSILHPSAEHEYVVADFTQPQKLKGIITDFIKDTVVEILINNTGGPPGGAIYQARTDEFVNAFHQHLICNHIMMQAVTPSMIRVGYGRIINIISTSVKQPIDNLGVSNTIRAAVANWSKTLANELGQFNITVNNVLPGLTDTARLNSLIENFAERLGQTPQSLKTQMTNVIPMKRIAQPEEIATVIAFLASPAANYVNGVNIPVDGGSTKCL